MNLATTSLPVPDSPCRKTVVSVDATLYLLIVKLPGPADRSRQPQGFYPAVGDRFSPKEWNEKGKPDILQRAIAEKKRVLASRFPRHVPKTIDDKLRLRFGDMVRLPRSGMGG